MISDLINKIKMKVGPLDQLTSKSDPINRGEIIKIIKRNKTKKQNKMYTIKQTLLLLVIASSTMAVKLQADSQNPF